MPARTIRDYRMIENLVMKMIDEGIFHTLPHEIKWWYIQQLA